MLLTLTKICFVVSIMGFQIGTGDVQLGSVYIQDGVAHFVGGKMDQNAAAVAKFERNLMTDGWDTLHIKAGYGGMISNTDLMYAAGYIEGIMSAGQIWSNYQNLRGFFLPSSDPSSNHSEIVYRRFFQEQESWSEYNAKKYGKSDPLWRHYTYIQAQLNGLADGYKAGAKPGWVTDKFVVQFLNGVGDLLDLKHALIPNTRPDFNKMEKHEMLTYIRERGHCSALVKVTGAYEDIYMAHSSWFSYMATLRIYKHYDFNIQDNFTASKTSSFSSYPAFLESLDDFYILGNGLVVLQTTNNVFNTSLYDLVTPSSLLAWQRVRLANQMSRGGEDWKNILSRYNSGTYNNQYMVIDLNKVHLLESIDDDALWVVEQIPGLVTGHDQTDILRTGYWPSYNVPFFEEIYNKSGYPGVVKKQGVDLSYQLAPRAKIFRRDADKVFTFDDMKAIMRFNDFKEDNYSEGSPWNSICSRGDLDPTNPSPMGCYDSKVTNYKMALKRKAYAISGPTLGTSLPSFSWKDFPSYPHSGLPDTYNFTWVLMQPYL